MTALQGRIVADLRANGPSTAKAIARRIDRSANSVRNSLTWLRGAGVVDDGAHHVEVHDKRGRLLGVASTDPEYPIEWRLR